MPIYSSPRPQLSKVSPSSKSRCTTLDLVFESYVRVEVAAKGSRRVEEYHPKSNKSPVMDTSAETGRQGKSKEVELKKK